MKIVKSDERGLEEAANVLLSGGVVVIPTDTVYGLAAHPKFPKAVARLYTIKGRAEAKPIALLAADAKATGLNALTYINSELIYSLTAKWPGALTIVYGGEGYRVPDHDWTRQLLARCGGLLRVTSANLSGKRAATDAEGALAEVGLSADLVVDDGISPGGEASTVVKIEEGGSLTLLREGPVRINMI